MKRGDVLAILAIEEVLRSRKRHREEQGIEEEGPPPSGVAYVLRSLKHKAEAEALRRIYRERFILIGAHAPRDWRLNELADAIAQSHGSTSRRDWQARAYELARRDEAEDGDDFGQNVRGTFPLADFFVDVSSRERAAMELERFFRAIFGYPYASPTPDEYAMFHAAAASVRSADLSRQVGAAIATDRGDIVAVGCNEVPAFGGGAYWPGDPNDARDFVRGEDANARLRNTAIEEIRQLLVESTKRLATSKLRSMSAEQFRELLGDTRIDNLTEFNRAVHAEMAALLDAARRGTSVRGATLYSTTFPCHNCAKHLVGAGIARVLYIEPYAKGLAEALHPDAIAIDRMRPPRGLVDFRQFVGVAPSIYMPLYTMGSIERKVNGLAVDFNPREAKPKLVPSGDLTYIERELLGIRRLSADLRRRQISLSD